MRSCLIAKGGGPAVDAGVAALLVDMRRPSDFGAALETIAQARALQSRPAVYVWLSPGARALGDALAALLPAPPDGVFLDGAESGASVQRLGARLAVFEARAGLEDGALPIVAMAAGTPASVFALGSFAGCSPRLKALAFARDELAAALGVKPAAAPIAQARALLVLAAAGAGVPALDAPALDGGLEEECLAARRDGFAGKLAAKPEEIGVIEKLFGALDRP